jgi:hypothetical protein
MNKHEDCACWCHDCISCIHTKASALCLLDRLTRQHLIFSDIRRPYLRGPCFSDPMKWGKRKPLHMDYSREADECLRKRDYAGYLRNCRKQYEITKSPEDRANVDRAEKMHELSTEIDEFLKKDKSDYYGILGVQRTATQEEIRQAFNRLVLRFHPDRTRMEESNAVSRIIQKAYLVLSNPEKKREYDNRESSSSVFNNVRFRYVDASEIPTDILFQAFASQVYGGFPNVNQEIYENLYRYTSRRSAFRRTHMRQEIPNYRAFMVLLILLLLVFF